MTNDADIGKERHESTTSSQEDLQSFVSREGCSNDADDVSEPASYVPNNPDDEEKLIFFRQVEISPEIPIRIDFNGKKLDTSNGTAEALIVLLSQFQNLEITLRKISNSSGILGFENVFLALLNEWKVDIRDHQKTQFITSYCGINPVIEIVRGIYNFFAIPLEQYKHDGCIARGIQRGAYSFGTSVATASIQIVNLMLITVQGASEIVFNVVNPTPSAIQERRRRYRRQRKAVTASPRDIREGCNVAVETFINTIGETFDDLVCAARDEHEQRGLPGAIGGVVRNVLPATIRPIQSAASASAHIIQGVQNQLRPDMHHEAAQKWKEIP